MHLWESIGFRVCHRQSNNSSNAFICRLSTDYTWFAYFVVRISVTYCISCLRMERITFGTVSGYQWFLKFLYNFSNISQVWRQPRCHPGKIINGFVNRFIYLWRAMRVVTHPTQNVREAICLTNVYFERRSYWCPYRLDLLKIFDLLVNLIMTASLHTYRRRTTARRRLSHWWDQIQKRGKNSSSCW